MKLTGRMPELYVEAPEGEITANTGRDNPGERLDKAALARLVKEMEFINKAQKKMDVRIVSECERVREAVPLFLVKERRPDEILFHPYASVLSCSFNNSSLTLGGRPTSLMSSLPRGVRPSRTVNGKPLVEIDVRASHANIGFAMLGMQAKTPDLYKLPGFSDEENKELRPAIKSFINVSLNLKPSDKRWWKEAVTKGLLEQQLKARKAAAILGETLPPLWKADDIMALLPRVKTEVERAHPELVKFFATDFGVKAMYVEGEMMRSVLTVAAEEDFVLIPLHDAVFCHAEYVPYVCDLLRWAFECVTGVGLPDFCLKVEGLV
jgi:hypothetical protein